MKHTQGEWQAYNATGKNGRILNTWYVQSVNPLNTDMRGTAKICTLDDTMGEAHNNARLIAAAPDLLEALQGLVEYLGWREDFICEDHDNGEFNQYSAALKAINKAL